MSLHPFCLFAYKRPALPDDALGKICVGNWVYTVKSIGHNGKGSSARFKCGFVGDRIDAVGKTA